MSNRQATTNGNVQFVVRSSLLGLRRLKPVYVRNVYAYAAPILLLLFAIASSRHMWGHGTQYAFGDLPPFPDSFQSAWQRYTDGWTTRQLGMPLPPITVDLLSGVLTVIFFNNPVFAQHFFIAALIPLALLSAYLFARDCGISRFGAVCSAMVFALNPATLGDMIGGTEVSTIFGIALLPLLLWSLLKFLRRPFWRTGLALGLLTGFFLAIYVHGAVLLVIIAPVVAGAWLTQPGNSKPPLRTYVVPALLALLTVVLISMPLISQSSLFIPVQGNQNGAQSVIFSASRVQQFLVEAQYAYSLAPPALAARLAGAGAVLGYSDLTPRTALGYVTVVWFVLAVWFFFRGCRDLSLCIGIVLTLLSVGFILGTHYGLLYWAFVRFPILFVFRNPVQPLMMASLGVALLGGYVVGRLAERRNVFVSLAILSFVCYAIYVGPSAFSGDFEISALRKDPIISSDYIAIAKYINEIGPQRYYRVLWLPADYEEVQIKTKFLPVNLLEVQYGAAQFYYTPSAAYLEEAFDEVASGQTRRLGHLIAPFLGLFVLVDKQSMAADSKGAPHVILPYNTPYLTGEPAQLVKLCGEQTDLRLIYENNRFALFLNEAMGA